jgi:5-methylcytosine-specific restriction endonuclease McrA
LRWSDPDQRAAHARLMTGRRWGDTRLCGCGHVVPRYEGHYRQKCDDCVGLMCRSAGCSTSVPRNHKWCAGCLAEIRRLAPKDNLAIECSEPDCVRPVRARGVCNMHYKRILSAEGRFKPRPWDERRRMNDQTRRARKVDAFVEPVSLDVVAERDGFCCGICSDPVDMSLAYPDPFSRSLDHIVPLSRGGEHSYSNTQLSHLRCNVSKGAKSPASSAVA